VVESARNWEDVNNDENNMNDIVFDYRAPTVGAMNPNDIRYPCFFCGPSDSQGFTRARDFVKHSVCSHKHYPKDVQQGHVNACDGSDMKEATDEERARYRNGSHWGKKKLEEAAKAKDEKAQEDARTKSGENAKRQDVAGTSKEVDVGEQVKLFSPL